MTVRHPPPLARSPARAAPRRSLFSSLFVARSLIQSPLAAQWPPRRWRAPSPRSPHPPPPSARPCAVFTSARAHRQRRPPRRASSRVSGERRAPGEEAAAGGGEGRGQRGGSRATEEGGGEPQDRLPEGALHHPLARGHQGRPRQARVRQGHPRLLPRTVLEALHNRVVALRLESALKVFELMRDQVFRSVHPPRPSPRSACCVFLQVKKEEEFSTGPLSLLLMSVKNITHRTRASWPIKAHGARKRRKEVVRHRHGGGGWARTEEDRAPLFFQVSEQHQEEELKHDHREAPPQQQMSPSMKRQRLL
ncbi:hypothetical protein ACQJBY_068319 [Aegilops geniculata]